MQGLPDIPLTAILEYASHPSDPAKALDAVDNTEYNFRLYHWITKYQLVCKKWKDLLWKPYVWRNVKTDAIQFIQGVLQYGADRYARSNLDKRRKLMFGPEGETAYRRTAYLIASCIVRPATIDLIDHISSMFPGGITPEEVLEVSEYHWEKMSGGNVRKI